MENEIDGRCIPVTTWPAGGYSVDRNSPHQCGPGRKQRGRLRIGEDGSSRGAVGAPRPGSPGGRGGGPRRTLGFVPALHQQQQPLGGQDGAGMGDAAGGDVVEAVEEASVGPARALCQRAGCANPRPNRLLVEARWPLCPMPRICRSTPPAAAMAALVVSGEAGAHPAGRRPAADAAGSMPSGVITSPR